MIQISQEQVNFLIIDEQHESQRLDNFLIKVLKGVPKSHVYRIIRGGEVRANKKRCKAEYKLQLNDVIRIPPIRIAEKPTSEQDFIPQANFPIVYEDEFYLIINKLSGVACHGGSGVSFGVIEQLRRQEQYKFLELAHRLDRETSGILILAKKRQALVAVQNLMRHHKMLKEYYALTLGRWVDDKRIIKAPITKFINKEGERRVRIDRENGMESHTIFTMLKRYKDFTLVNADLHTGRTHQIRIHLQHIGYPIAFDEKYGNFDYNKQLPTMGLKRMFLHCHHLQFIHPMTDELLDLNCPLPENLQNFIDSLPHGK